jgi:hypothetical protein
MGNRRIRSDWTEEEAVDLLAQGYTPAQVARVTGFRVRWVEEQRVPRGTLLERVGGTQSR